MIDQWLLQTERRRTALTFEQRRVLDFPEVVGVIEHMSLGSCLDVVTVDLQAHGDVCLTARDDRESELICGLTLDSGRVQQELPELEPIWLSGGESLLFRPSRRCSDYRIPAGTKLRAPAYYIDPRRLLQSIEGEPPAAVEALLTDGHSCHVSRRFHLGDDGELRRLAREIMQRGPSDTLRNLRIEARVLEMLERQLRVLDAGTNGGAEPRRQRDARIDDAVRLLCADLRSPPSPGALARIVGLSERQLQAGFRERMGTTVAEYLREQRLARARQWLGTGDLSTSAVAARVGYANASNLINALRRRYGLTPGEIRQERASAEASTGSAHGGPQDVHGD